MLENVSILAVDDEPFNLDLIEAAFEDYDNVRITNAVNGQEALDRLADMEFDVVLLDISMPGMDGLEVLQKIRENEKHAQLPVLIVTANAEKEREAIVIGASDFIAKPYDIEILCGRTLNYAKMNFYHKQVANQKETLELKVLERTAELQQALKIAKRTEYEISIRLGRASEFRDLETGGHIKRMSHYSKLLAKLYGLDDTECELILYAAPLHDIGKIGIPDNILLKPGKFENNEFEIMKTHAQLGANMLEGADRFPVLKAGYTIVLEHHEKYDGSGYPNGIKGRNIHLYARIITIADVFDALSSRRCYKEPMALEKVLSIMKNDSGTHFDPELLNIFLTNIEKFLEIKEIYKDEYCLPFKEKIQVQNENKLKVLFVDDNELNRLLVQEMVILVFPNIIIKTFSNAKDVLETTLVDYDLILSDISMPEMDGFELYTALKERKNFTKPIIALTGLADKKKILEYGFDDYISKPIDIKELEDTINKYF